MTSTRQIRPEQAEIERLRREVASLRHTPISSRQMPSFVFGADIGKYTFHLVGLDKRGAIAPRYRSQRQAAFRHGGAHVEFCFRLS